MIHTARYYTSSFRKQNSSSTLYTSSSGSSFALFLLLILLAFFFFFFPEQARGWGNAGHQLTARLAMSFLTLNASKFDLQMLPHDKGNITLIATWADAIKSNPAYAWSAQLHYVDTPDFECTYSFQRDCVKEMCVDSAIQNYTCRLQNQSLDFDQRQEALKFLVHFIGDVHQPLHAGFDGDAGGNEIKGHFFGKEYNLHSLWDNGLISRRMSLDFQNNQDAYYQFLLREMLNHTYSQNLTDWMKCSSKSNETNYGACSDDWVWESVILDCRTVYIAEDGKTHVTKDTGFNFSNVYYDRNIPVVEQRLVQAAIRIANVINQIVQSISNDENDRITGLLYPLIASMKKSKSFHSAYQDLF